MVSVKTGTGFKHLIYYCTVKNYTYGCVHYKIAHVRFKEEPASFLFQTRVKKKNNVRSKGYWEHLKKIDIRGIKVISREFYEYHKEVFCKKVNILRKLHTCAKKQ